MDRVCMVPDLVAELVLGRVCYGPRCPGILYLGRPFFLVARNT